MSGIFLMLIFISVNGHSQTENSDSLFQIVQQHARNENYDGAIEEIKYLIGKYPQNSDYQTYLSRLYYWKKDVASALKIISPLLLSNPKNEEILALSVSLELANENYDEVIKQSDTGIQEFPDRAGFYLIKKSIALGITNQDKQALTALKSISKDSDFYKDAQEIKTQILKKQKNTISVGYLNTSFGNAGLAPWQLMHIEYMRKTTGIAYVGRLNYGYVYGKSSVQAEMDAYPKIGKKSYLYLNAGISDGNSTFPLFRFGAEIYKDFSIYNTSLGLRYLHFKTDKVALVTGHFAVNFNSFQIAYRPYLGLKGNEWLPSHILSFQKSFENHESYIQLNMQYGVLPYFFIISDEFQRVSSYRLGVSGKFRIMDNLFIQPLVMQEWEEYFPGKFRNRLNVQLVLSKRF